MATKKQKPLPTKEQALFRSILKFYERKQYKKGLKAAEQILKKFPEHGETLAMKGLTLNCMDKKTEAYELAKRGIKNDLMSHVCWHVLGLLYRSDRDYVEASKCYNTALKHDKENIIILRDLSLLQIQLRQYKDYKETRRKLVQLKYKQKNNWIAYSIAAHLSKDFKNSLLALEQFAEKPEQVEYEYSEVLLYKNMIIEESGDLEEALKQLDQDKPMIMDLLSWQEKRAELLLKLGRKEDAKQEYLSLLNINCENYEYFNGYLKAHDLPEFFTPSSSNLSDCVEYDENSQQFEILNCLAAQFPTSHTVRELPMRFFTGDKFRDAIDKYLKKGFTKGTPSLFTATKWIYSNPKKVEIIEKLLHSYSDSLENSQSWPDNNEEKVKPSILLWVTFFLAQHYDFKRDFQKAFEYIDKAIKHTPTVIDLYCAKGKFYKHVGNLKNASKEFETARELDLADRYLNTKSTLHLLRYDQVEKADEVIGLFTREGDNSASNLFDMQCVWYERECGESLERTGQYGKSLKKFKAILTHFSDISEDQFDFHTYCLRKMTLRSYVKLLRFEDNLFGHPNHLAAVCGIIRIYLHLNEKESEQKKESKEEDPSLANLSTQDRKKAESKKRRAEARAKKQREEEEKKIAQIQKDKGKSKGIPLDDDPNGEKLVNVEDKLKEASKYAQSVRGYANNNLEIQHLSFKVYMLREKYLLALQALKTSIHIAPRHPETHKNKIEFLNKVVKNEDLEKKCDNNIVVEVIKEERDALLCGLSTEKLNQEYLNQNKDNILSILAGAEIIFKGNEKSLEKKSEALSYLRRIFDVSDLNHKLKECVEVHKKIKDVFKDESLANELYEKLKSVFPYSSYFNPEQDEDEQQQQQQQQ